MNGIVKRVRDGFNAGTTRRIDWRLEQIKATKRLIEENKEILEKALSADLGTNEFWIHAVELDAALIECKNAIAHLSEWVKPEGVSTPLLNLPAKSVIMREPFGVALVIAPWNYPVSLLLNPLVAAIAAGNAVVLKPSEVSVNTSRELARLIPKYLDPVCVAVVEGAVEETTQLLKERFDIIMYTGNTAVGKIVMKAAAEYLTPVILELGGKCPAIVAPDANISNTAKRIVWGKWSLNNGQTCVAPDYIITTEAMEAPLLKQLKQTITDFYGENPKESKDISRMINERHTKRVADLLEDKKIEEVTGGKATVDIRGRYIAPTIVRCGPDAKLMKDEIFGPVLPVLVVKNMDEALDFVNKGEKPLALYVFTESNSFAKSTLERTSSGGACVNDIGMHVGNSNLPFGGVGSSGMGAYHGKHGFDAFSHKKSVFIKSGTDPSLRFPPYTESKLKWIRRLRSLHLGALKKPALLSLVVLFLAILYKYAK
jgi:aldehyde dehydrogenase (NAD+)